MTLDPTSKVTPEQLALIRPLVEAACGGPWEPHKGAMSEIGLIDCPVCGQRKAIRYHRAGLDGKINVVCITPECVMWREID